MKINLKFSENDFDSFKSFEKSIQKQLGNNTYIGTDSLCLYFEYPKSLKAMLRPYPESKKFEFTLENNK